MAPFKKMDRTSRWTSSYCPPDHNVRPFAMSADLVFHPLTMSRPDLRALTASARSRPPPPPAHGLCPLTASARSRSPLTVSACSRSPLAHDLRPLTASARSPPPLTHRLRPLTASACSRPLTAHDLRPLTASACSRSPLAHGARTMSGLTVLYYTSESREVVGCKSRYLTITKRVHKQTKKVVKTTLYFVRSKAHSRHGRAAPLPPR